MKPRASHIFPKAKNGWYVEPSWCSRRLFDVEKFGGGIYDPACGWGTILKEAKAAGYKICGSDLIDRRHSQLPGFPFEARDFLALETVIDPRWGVVCNPPFDLITEFCCHALTMGTTKVAMIMLVRRLNAAHWLRQLPLRRVWLLTPRPSMPPGEWVAAGNEPGGGTQDFCWLVFERGYMGKPAIDWLHREKGS
jgi:hypothetical protein